MTLTRFPVEASHILMFARAIADPSPRYDKWADGDGDVIAPPTFVGAASQFDPDFSLRPKPGEPWVGSGKEATGRPQPADAGSAPLHAEQHYEYHRPLRPGDVLSPVQVPGEKWEKEGRSGKLEFESIVTEYRDEAGELVLTSRSVVVRTQLGKQA